MDNVNKLQSYSTELATAMTSFLGHSQEVNSQQDLSSQGAPDSEELQKAREDILSLLAKIRKLICGPTDFLQQLGSQVCITNSPYCLASENMIKYRAKLTGAKFLITEQDPCLFAVVRRESDPCLYSLGWKRSNKGHCRSDWRFCYASEPYCPSNCNCRFPRRAQSCICCSLTALCVISLESLASRRRNVSLGIHRPSHSANN